MQPEPAIAYIALPPPISTNALFANASGRGRVKTKEYRVWCGEAAKWFLAQRPLPRFTDPVNISLYVGEVDVGDMDSDNTPKAYLDALVSAKIIKDDSRKYVRSSSAVWTPGLRGCLAKITHSLPPPSAEQIAGCIPVSLRGLLLK
jgi:Holliday junction resolvase RusA-like endonuclease